LTSGTLETSLPWFKHAFPNADAIHLPEALVWEKTRTIEILRGIKDVHPGVKYISTLLPVWRVSIDEHLEELEG
jgi:hypothetical protein